MAANAIISINVGDPSKDFAMVGLEPSGKITPLFDSRADFDAKRKANPGLITDLGLTGIDCSSITTIWAGPG